MTPREAARTCPSCTRVVSTGWSVCAWCGRAADGIDALTPEPLPAVTVPPAPPRGLDESTEEFEPTGEDTGSPEQDTKGEETSREETPGVIASPDVIERMVAMLRASWNPIHAGRFEHRFPGVDVRTSLEERAPPEVLNISEGFYLHRTRTGLPPAHIEEMEQLALRYLPPEGFISTQDLLLSVPDYITPAVDFLRQHTRGPEILWGILRAHEDVLTNENNLLVARVVAYDEVDEDPVEATPAVEPYERAPTATQAELPEEPMEGAKPTGDEEIRSGKGAGADVVGAPGSASSSLLDQELTSILSFPPSEQVWDELCEMVAQLTEQGALSASMRRKVLESIDSWPDELRRIRGAWSLSGGNEPPVLVWLARSVTLDGVQITRDMADRLSLYPEPPGVRELHLNACEIEPGALTRLLTNLPEIHRLHIRSPELIPSAVASAICEGLGSLNLHLTIADVELRDHGLSQILKRLDGRLVSLHLERVALSEQAIRYLSSATPRAPTLDSLDSLVLDGHTFDIASYRRLETSPVIQRLSHLGLRNANLDLNRLGLGFWPELVSLDLHGNPLEPASVSALASTPRPEELRRLNLSACALSARDVGVLARGLIFDGLTHLDLSDNPMGAEGLRALVESPMLLDLEELNLPRCAIPVSSWSLVEGSYALRNVKIQW
jgi:hypothetical protein